MSEILLGVLRMPHDLFWTNDPVMRQQYDAIRLEAAAEIERLTTIIHDEIRHHEEAAEVSRSPEAWRYHRECVRRLCANERQGSCRGYKAAADAAAEEKPCMTPTWQSPDGRLPQRFAWKNSHDNLWQFGVVFPMTTDGVEWWSIRAGCGHGSFDDDPWEMLGHIIGDAAAFQWIDNDNGWHPQ